MILLLSSLFLFGLIIGSFLNVVVLRGETDESLGGRSHCPHCRNTIAWYDNIPVFSFLFLRGQCRHCKVNIAWQYPLVEFGTGVLFMLLAWGFFSHVSSILFIDGRSLLQFGLFVILASLLMVVVVSDIRTMTIPLLHLWGALGVAGLLVGLRFVFPESVLLFQPSGWSLLLGGGVAAAFFYALVFFSHETWMGMGDVWVAGVLGLTVGIEFLLFTLTLSFLFGAIVGILLLVLGQKGLRSQIPFAPFLIVATLAAWILLWVYPTWIELFLLPPIFGLTS